MQLEESDCQFTEARAVSSLLPSAQSEFLSWSLQDLPVFLLWRWKAYFSTSPYRHPGWCNQGRKKVVMEGQQQGKDRRIWNERPWWTLEKACGDWPLGHGQEKVLVKKYTYVFSLFSPQDMLWCADKVRTWETCFILVFLGLQSWSQILSHL